MRRLFASLLAALVLLPLGPAIAAEPLPKPKKIFFATGSTRGIAGGHVQRGRYDLHSLTANEGQLLTVTVTIPDDNALFHIYAPGTTLGRDADGTLQFHGRALHVPGDGNDSTRWSGRLPATGTYLIAIGSTRGNARYSMDVRLE
ncbi:MAG: hypothetical protein KIS73_04745 [Enhydrobacter sp.]|nr:hypothetical protein [Enhydrobacter sp.]